MKSDEFKNLPKKLKHVMDSLEYDLEHYKKKTQEISGETETNVKIDRYNNPINLPNNSRVSFILHNGSKVDVFHSIENNTLEVYLASVSDDIFIKSCTSNTFKIVVKEG